MIERYALFDTSQLQQRFATANTILSNYKKRYNVVPTQQVPVIVQREGERRIEFKHWGLVPQNARDTNGVFRYKTYAVREEDVFEKPSTERLARTQRCIIPVNGFYLWNKGTEARPYFVHLAEYAPFGLAGIYSSWTTPEGVEQATFAMLTVRSGVTFAAISDRAPVIVPRDNEATWLDPARHDMSTVYDITRPYAGGDLRLDAVSDDIYSKKIDASRLIKLVD